jgi:multiple sugar transport system ATP-binding protein
VKDQGSSEADIATANGMTPGIKGVAVTARNLQRAFSKDNAAVDIEELVVQPGEFVTLVGPSGCGKTTTLRMIAGLERPDCGEILFDDRVVNEVSVQKRNVAIVFQNYGLYPHMRVEANLEYGLKRHGVSRAERKSQVTLMAKLLGIQHLLSRKPSQLSGGEQQRVALGRAIIRQPSVLLLDEPLSNLDAKLRGQMRGELVKLHRKVGGTIIYVTHDQLEAMTMPDRVAVMRDGKVQQFDVPQRIYNSPANRFVAGFLGSPTMNFIDGEAKMQDGLLVFVMPGGQVPLDGAIGEVLRRDGADRSLTLGIRPEKLVVSSEAGSLPATVILIELVGAEKYVVFDSPAGELTARMDIDRPIAIGDRLYCIIQPDRIHLFDRESGLAVSRIDPPQMVETPTLSAGSVV